MLPGMRDGLVRVLAADPKLMELAFGRALSSATAPMRVTRWPITVMLEQAVRDMQAHAALLAGKQRDHAPTVEHPFTVVLVDEVAFLTAAVP